MPLQSAATPRGVLKRADVPAPSRKAAVPFPASVVTFHKHTGSALRPAAPQLAGVMQGVAGAGLPPGQKRPGAHCVALAALTEPAAHPKPGGALHGPLQEALARPGAAPNTPGGQGRQKALEAAPR